MRFDLRPVAAKAAAGRFVLLVLLSPIVLVARGQSAQTTTVAAVLSCQAFERQSTLADLNVRYGNANVAALEVSWRDEARKRIGQATTANRDSLWKTSHGLKVGMAIADVAELNGRAFVVRGFDQDDAGAVVTWAGGKLTAGNTDTCRVLVRLEPTVDHFTTLEFRLVDAIRGTPEVASDDRRIRPFRAEVTMIGLEWRD